MQQNNTEMRVIAESIALSNPYAMRPLDQTRFKGRVIQCSNHFKVQYPDKTLRSMCLDFSRRFIRIDQQITRNTVVDATTPMTVFAVANTERTEFRFHIHAYPEFEKQLALWAIRTDDLEIVRQAPPEGKVVKLPMFSKWQPREDQVPNIEFGLRKDINIKLLGTQTGGGKSFMGSFIASKMGKRILMIVKPMYINKWIGDFAGFYDIPKKSMMVVQGGDALKAFTILAEEDKLGDTRIILMSSKTLQNWLKLHRTSGIDGCQAAGYMWGPDEMWEKAQIGTRMIDEVHQEFHLFFLLDLYTNVEETLSMSATLDNNDPKTKEMYLLAYPQANRKENLVFKNYIDVYSVNYCLSSTTRYRINEYGRTEYSHLAYEKSIMRDQKSFFPNYVNMVKVQLKEGYIDIKKEGQRALVFFATTEMCTAVRDELRKEWPHLRIERFCGTMGDSKDFIKDSSIHILVSTVLSSGTAHDIPGLICTVQTIGIGSLQANKQSLGRLRFIKDQKLSFYFLTCKDIPKHDQYYGARKVMFRDSAKSFSDIWYRGYI